MAKAGKDQWPEGGRGPATGRLAWGEPVLLERAFLGRLTGGGAVHLHLGVASRSGRVWARVADSGDLDILERLVRDEVLPFYARCGERPRLLTCEDDPQFRRDTSLPLAFHFSAEGMESRRPGKPAINDPARRIVDLFRREVVGGDEILGDSIDSLRGKLGLWISKRNKRCARPGGAGAAVGAPPRDGNE